MIIPPRHLICISSLADLKLKSWFPRNLITSQSSSAKHLISLYSQELKSEMWVLSLIYTSPSFSIQSINKFCQFDHQDTTQHPEFFPRMSLVICSSLCDYPCLDCNKSLLVSVCTFFLSSLQSILHRSSNLTF